MAFDNNDGARYKVSYTLDVRRSSRPFLLSTVSGAMSRSISYGTFDRDRRSAQHYAGLVYWARLLRPAEAGIVSFSIQAKRGPPSL